MNKRYVLPSFVVLCLMGAVCLISSVGAADSTDTAPAIMKPGPSDRCPVCGMFPHKHPKWAAGIIFQDGSTYVHCSPKCMLHNLHNISKYQPAQTRDTVKQVWVTEYYSTKPMDAKEALFVTGANVTGPMGLDIVPVKGLEAAENLMRDYKGKQIVPLDRITDDMIEQARRGRKKHP